jgi:hypothetical protein
MAEKRESGTCACFWCYWLVQPTGRALLASNAPWEPRFYCWHPERVKDGMAWEGSIMPDSVDPAWCPGIALDKPVLT